MRSAPLLFLSALACAPVPSGGDLDTGLAEGADLAAPATTATTRCAWSYEEVDADYVGEGALSAAAVMETAGGPRRTTLRWDASSEETALDLELRDPVRYRLGVASGPECVPHLLVDATLTLSTADGHLDEVLEVTVRSEGGPVRVETWLPLEALVGSWQPVEVDPSSWDLVDVEIVAELSAGDSVGELALYAQRYRDDREEVVAIDAGRWPAP